MTSLRNCFESHDVPICPLNPLFKDVNNPADSSSSFYIYTKKQTYPLEFH
ncbi:hypothetical protein HanIR_Chr13g0663241 [Helianthus annuus]|nr:hypothetical protein HanIR_Chr13g0663241 [Helianthus annuus]